MLGMACDALLGEQAGSVPVLLGRDRLESFSESSSSLGGFGLYMLPLPTQELR